MRRRIFIIAGYYVLIVVGLFLILAGVGWYLTKQKQVRLGMARPDFPYFKYSQEELNKLYPQYPLEDVKTTQTPEQTYAKFISALKAGDLGGLEGLFTERKKNAYLEVVEKAKKDGTIGTLLDKLNFSIKQKEVNNSFAVYRLEDGKENSLILFEKNINGVWQIDSL